MIEGAAGSGEEAIGRLQRCIRDLAALNALPSMCVGRSPDEALTIVLEALPTALSCELVFVSLPGSPPKQCARVAGKDLTEAQLTALEAALGAEAAASGTVQVDGVGRLWCLEVELPLGSGRGRLVAGRAQPLHPETDRVLIRSAANLIGSVLEAAHLLETAHHKDEFLAMLGHELRNPLAPIMTAVELLARHPVAAREQKVIERQARHLTRLVDDLLDISRVTRGHIELRKERVALSTVLERAVELAAPLVARHRHALRVDSADGIVLQGDSVRLAQIFGNLLTNAAKFSAPEGRIEVSVERSPRRVRVTVRDNGRGIAREHLQRIFEPFMQAQGARDAARGGLGLGLAIVKNLVERHDGTVSVESKGEGQGASFSVELPTLEYTPTVEPAAPVRSARERTGLRVLVVDDNVDIAQLLSEALQLHGFETTTAYDAPAALDLWRRFVPQAAVLDLGLPGLDGYELARRLRDEHGQAPVLIAATGYGQPQDRVRSVAAGFDCHLIKPVSVPELVRLLDGRLTEIATSTRTG